ncbi:MAG TPA: bifunctional glutamate N-acetyltransferase/amino-acid acetyltransferase ArgJ [Anaerolineae bacterium]|nr:bifunctional glutamate N-acetyltransferase/amino-acid acetyltransferase ArgJ [Anaerolineae bacterium]
MTDSTSLVAGFRFAGVSCGIKPKTAAYGDRALDLALIVSDQPCNAAGVFTQNQFPAAPVLFDKKTLAANARSIRAVVINAGNANACTGEQGLKDAAASAHLVDTALDLPANATLVLSTGVIGLPLPMTRIEAGIRAAAVLARSETGQSSEGLALASQAIMTTDTKPKTASRQAGQATLLGIAKGAAMIHPNMATLLAVVITDAAIQPDALQAMLRRAAGRSFNAITVDGDQSTNDTLLVLANGLAGPVDAAAFEQALTEVCQSLAQQMVRDAEGASKFVTVRVTGAANEAAARAVAKTVAASVLFKTAVYGGDPNWGRVLMAAGNSGVSIDPVRVALWFAGDGGQPLQVVANGAPLTYSEAEAAAIFACADLDVRLDLGAGGAKAAVWTSDLTHDYVTLNAHYRT